MEVSKGGELGGGVNVIYIYVFKVLYDYWYLGEEEGGGNVIYIYVLSIVWLLVFGGGGGV